MNCRIILPSLSGAVVLLGGVTVEAGSKYYRGSSPRGSSAASVPFVAAVPILTTNSAGANVSSLVVNQPTLSFAAPLVTTSQFVVPSQSLLLSPSTAGISLFTTTTSGNSASQSSNTASKETAGAAAAENSCEQDPEIKRKIEAKLDSIERLLNERPWWECQIP